jgi:hypothetical protein
MLVRSTGALFALAALCACATSPPPPHAWVENGPNVNYAPAPGEQIRTYTATELRATAVHEAAHAVAIAGYHGAVTVTMIDVHECTPDGSLHDHIGVVENDRRSMRHPREVLQRIVVSRIGIIAERMLASSDGGGETDLRNATDAAWHLYTRHAWRRDRFCFDPETAPPQIRAKVALAVEAGDRCATRMVMTNRVLILALADHLLRQPSVNGIRSIDRATFVRFMEGRTVVVPECGPRYD